MDSQQIGLEKLKPVDGQEEEEEIDLMLEEMSLEDWHRFSFYRKSIIPIVELNNDCLAHVFSFLNVPERVRFERVCKRWREAIDMSWRGVRTLDIRTRFDERIRMEIPLYALKKILSLCGNSLRNFKGCGYERLYPPLELLKLLQEMCPNLRSLEIEGMKSTIDILEYLTENFENLTEFEVGSTPRSCEDALSKFFASKNLKSIALDSTHQLTGECLLHLNTHCIEYLRLGLLGSCKKYFEQIVPKLINLNGLSIRADSIRFMDSLPQKSKLKSLELNIILLPFKGFSFEFLKEFTNLEDLKLDGPPKVYVDALCIIGSHCKNLKRLSLNATNQLFDVNAEEIGLRYINQLSNLQRLELVFQNYQVPDEVFTEILPDLVSLDCYECSNVHNKGLIFVLKNSPKLENLCITSDNSDLTNLEDVHAAAKEAVNARTNGVKLRLRLLGRSGGGRVRRGELHLQSQMIMNF